MKRQRVYPRIARLFGRRATAFRVHECMRTLFFERSHHQNGTWGRCIAIVMLLCIACRRDSPGATSPGDESARRVANLYAFARLYGVLRWFHPSDAGAAIDWNRFAIDGTRNVINAPDARALHIALGDLIAPIAPTVHVTAHDAPFPDEPALHPTSTAGLEVVAWQHVGYGDSTVVSEFASKRRHRERRVVVSGMPFAALWQAVDATPFRGAKLRLRGKLRTAHDGRGRLWVRVERGDERGFFDNMSDRPVRSPTWETTEIVGVVDADATRLVFGPMMSGVGSSWYDDIELAIQRADGTWKPIEIRDPGFESSDLSGSWRPGTGKAPYDTTDGWNVTQDSTSSAPTSRTLRIEAATKVITEELFSDSPRAGEFVDVELGSGLRARVPIALYSRAGRTIGDDPAAALRAQAKPPIVGPAGFDAIAGVADVIVVWNVLQHFWPYWEVVATDWTAELGRALTDALDDGSVDDHVRTLRRLSAAAPDGHAGTTCIGEAKRANPPFAVTLVENRVVVAVSADEAVARGDVIITIDGKLANEELSAAEALASGSPQWRQYRALQEFGRGPVGSSMTIGLRRGTTELVVRVERGTKRPREFSHRSVEQFNDRVFYLDLGRVTSKDLKEVQEQLATAPGIVLDLREHPNTDLADLFSHLLPRPDDAKEWGAVAHIIRPDHTASSIATWKTSGWELPALQPHISGRVAFLSGPGAISYSESLMAFVEHYRLGEIVGGATAGTNGNVAEITAPSGCRTSFTGARVTKLDGARHHLIGVQPTIPASRTLASVIAGRDDVLEKALAHVRAGPR